MVKEINEQGARRVYSNSVGWEGEKMRESLLNMDMGVMVAYLGKIARDGLDIQRMFFSEDELSEDKFYGSCSTVSDYIWFMEEQADRHYFLAERLKNNVNQLISAGEDVSSCGNLLEEMVAEKTASRNCLHETLYVEKTARDMGIFDAPIIMAGDFSV